jgi:hypothetical protein
MTSKSVRSLWMTSTNVSALFTKNNYTTSFQNNIITNLLGNELVREASLV